MASRIQGFRFRKSTACGLGFAGSGGIRAAPPQGNPKPGGGRKAPGEAKAMGGRVGGGGGGVGGGGGLGRRGAWGTDTEGVWWGSERDPT